MPTTSSPSLPLRTLSNLTLSDLPPLYHHLTTHLVPGPQSIHYIYPLLLFAALLISPSILAHSTVRAGFLPLIVGGTIRTWRESGAEVVSFTVRMWGVRLIGVGDAREWAWVGGRPVSEEAKGGKAVGNGTGERARGEEGKVVGAAEGGGESGVEVRYPERMGWERIKWVCTLLISLRLSGWKTGQKGHDAQQPYRYGSKGRFARHALGWVIMAFFILDATFLYVRYDPYFTTSGMSVDAAFPAMKNVPALVALLWRWSPPRMLRGAVLAAQVMAMVSGMFYLPTLPAAGLNAAGGLPDMWAPHTWPPFFGPFGEVWRRGLRGLWGGWWHQINREFVSAPGTALVDWLGLKRGGSGRYMVLVASSFGFSGMLHMGLVPPEPLTRAMTANQMRLYVAGFFWVQAFGIGVEVAAGRLVRRLEKQVGVVVRPWLANGLRLLWVAGWLSLVLPLLTVPFREIGYWHYSPIGPGLIGPVMNRLQR